MSTGVALGMGTRGLIFTAAEAVDCGVHMLVVESLPRCPVDR